VSVYLCLSVCVVTDRDECRENRSSCPRDAECHNINASFMCLCRHQFYYHRPTRSCRGLFVSFQQIITVFIYVLLQHAMIRPPTYTLIICYKNGVYGFYFVSCMNIIFNELRQQRVKLNMMFIQRAK